MIKYETNSKDILPGQIFVAIKGVNNDGHDYIEDAINNKASKIICERELNSLIPYEVVEDTNNYLKECLVNEYSNDFKNINIIGVTGTNGKTTTCFIIYEILKAFDINVAYIGTLGYHTKNTFIELNNTTPDILTLYKLLYKSLDEECEYVVMEISSHSLENERMKGIKFCAAGFTNLTQDHLDYHKTMSNYLESKLKIINYLDDEATLIVNSDDIYSDEFINKFDNTIKIGLFGDYKLDKYTLYKDHTKFKFIYKSKTYKVNIPLINLFNIYNYLVALAILHSLDFDLNDIIKNSTNISSPKGRCDVINYKNNIIVIDYAHTPDAVYKIISSFKELEHNNIITILGCGGNRDKSKRPIMGKISTSLSDHVIFTNDNPRNENQNDIINDITKEVTTNNYKIVYNREKAIKHGIKMLKSNDILLILGKGHEDYQIIGNKKTEFDDKRKAENILKNTTLFKKIWKIIKK